MYDVINNFTLQEPIYFTNLEITEHVKIKGLKVFLNNNYQEILENDSLFLNYLLNNINTYKYNYSCQDNKFLYLNILASTTNENEKEFFIANELKVITNDCNLKKDEILHLYFLFQPFVSQAYQFFLCKYHQCLVNDLLIHC